MKRDKHNHLIEAILIFLLGGVINIIFLCNGCLEEPFFLSKSFFINFSYSGAAWAAFWKGSQLTVDFLDHKIPWVETPVKRFTASLASVCLLVFVVVWGLDIFFELLFFNKTFSEMIEASGIPYWDALLITLGINVFMHGRGFLYSWRQAAIDVEKLKTEQVSTQYESLKNQVNPHFLFNSLNALTSLVYDDQAKAVEFIRKLSQVYRYVLDKKDEELVPVADELEFAKNYIYLQKIRFGDNLQVEVQGENQQMYVPPLALQLLVENTIKHNVVSEQYPLKVEISLDENYCTIRNTIKEKLEKDSTGIGLNNLKARYQYLSDKSIEIENENGVFAVKVPLLKFEE